MTHFLIRIDLEEALRRELGRLDGLYRWRVELFPWDFRLVATYIVLTFWGGRGTYRHAPPSCSRRRCLFRMFWQDRPMTGPQCRPLCGSELWYVPAPTCATFWWLPCLM